MLDTVCHLPVGEPDASIAVTLHASEHTPRNVTMIEVVG